MNPLSIILEYIQHGNLYSLIHNYEKEINWTITLTIALDVAKAMKYLHGISKLFVIIINTF